MSPVIRFGKLWFVLLLTIVFVFATRHGSGAEETNPAPAQDVEAKQKILESQAWKEAVRGFNEWLSVQIIYDKTQVAAVKQEFETKVDKMSSRELQDFLADLQERLVILGSKEALAARTWAEGNLNVLTKAKAEAFRKTLPDVAQMTSAQMVQALADLQQRRAAVRANQQALANMRHEKIDMIESMNRQTAEANARATANMSSGAGFNSSVSRSPYTPRPVARWPGAFTGGYGGYGYGYRW